MLSAVGSAHFEMDSSVPTALNGRVTLQRIEIRRYNMFRAYGSLCLIP